MVAWGMAPRPFQITGRAPGKPLSVKDIAKKYGLPASAAQEVRAFVAGVVSARTGMSKVAAPASTRKPARQGVRRIRTRQTARSKRPR